MCYIRRRTPSCHSKKSVLWSGLLASQTKMDASNKYYLEFTQRKTCYRCFKCQFLVEFQVPSWIKWHIFMNYVALCNINFISCQGIGHFFCQASCLGLGDRVIWILVWMLVLHRNRPLPFIYVTDIYWAPCGCFSLQEIKTWIKHSLCPPGTTNLKGDMDSAYCLYSWKKEEEEK